MARVKLDFSFLYRRKPPARDPEEFTRMHRVLGLFAITFIGVSCSLNGIYVMIGDSIRNDAGPSLIIAFVVAGLITMLAGLCYAEIGAKEPSCESAYSYTFVIIGEFLAFIVGWNFILQYIIGVSSDARALSQYIDSLLNSPIKHALGRIMPIKITGFSEYPDFLAFGLTIIMTGILVMNVKESSLFNKVVNGLNLFVIGFIILLGITQADLKNWFLPPASERLYYNETDNSTNETLNSSLPTILTEFNVNDKGGFFPFGFDGWLKSVNKCFYAYIGFDTIDNETKNPRKNIPIAIVLAISLCAACFLGLTIVLSLMMPYYLIDPAIPFPAAFTYNNLDWAKYFISFGIITSITASLYGEIFVMPRIVRSMAEDGLLFRFLERINRRFRTPAIATVITGFVSAVFAMIFNLDELLDMMSLCTLSGYAITSLCLIVIRYMPENTPSYDAAVPEQMKMLNEAIPETPQGPLQRSRLRQSFARVVAFKKEKSSKIVNWLVVIIALELIIISLHLRFITKIPVWVWAPVVSIATLLIILQSIYIYFQPQNSNYDTFTVPFIPFLPILSTFCDIYLMCHIKGFLWISMLIWLAIGLIVYFSYGVRHSIVRKKNIQTASQLESR